MKNFKLVTFFIFITGILFRLWFVKLSPQPFDGDQVVYHNFALGILKKGLYTESIRLYGYPLVLSILYRLFGQYRLVITIFQAILDTTTALLIFLIARKLFLKSIIPAFLATVLYLFNPFTSAFVDVLLSEILTIFLVTLFFFFFLLFLEKKTSLFLFTLVVILAFLPQVRPSLLFFSLALFSFLIILLTKISLEKRRLSLTIILLIILYLLPFSYNLVGNLIYFNQLSPMTVDNIFIREFYLSLYIDRFASPPASMDDYPAEGKKIYADYWLPRNKVQRAAVAKKYFNLAIEEVRKNPFKFVYQRIAKFWYVWEKHYLFPYKALTSKLVGFWVYWINVVLLFLALIGLRKFIKQAKSLKGRKIFKLFAYLVTFLFIYTSVLHSFSTAEERYSLPAYPFVFLFASYAIYWTINRFNFIGFFRNKTKLCINKRNHIL